MLTDDRLSPNCYRSPLPTVGSRWAIDPEFLSDELTSFVTAGLQLRSRLFQFTTISVQREDRLDVETAVASVELGLDAIGVFPQ
jgi:hypothetical protein